MLPSIRGGSWRSRNQVNCEGTQATHAVTAANKTVSLESRRTLDGAASQADGAYVIPSPPDHRRSKKKQRNLKKSS